MINYCYSLFLDEETEAQGEVTSLLSGSVPSILALDSVLFTIGKYCLSRVDLELLQDIFRGMHELLREKRMPVEFIDFLQLSHLISAPSKNNLHKNKVSTYLNITATFQISELID